MSWFGDFNASDLPLKLLLRVSEFLKVNIHLDGCRAFMSAKSAHKTFGTKNRASAMQQTKQNKTIAHGIAPLPAWVTGHGLR